jgi:plasmid stability protein
MNRTHDQESFLSARLPAELRKRLEQLAQQHDRSLSAEVRAALRWHLDVAGSATSSRPLTAPIERRVSVDPATEVRLLAGPLKEAT